MARDLPSERPVFDRARDTPGRDALQRRAAQKKTRNMFGPGTRNERNAGGMAAALAHKSGYGNPLPKETVMGKGPRGITQLDKLVGAKKFVSDAYWVATHPRDRVMGRGRSANQQMMWAGGKLGPGGSVVFNALKPSWRVPTNNPAWEIRRNKPDDLVVGLSGLKRFDPNPEQYGRRATAREMKRSREDVLVQQHQADWLDQQARQNPELRNDPDWIEQHANATNFAQYARQQHERDIRNRHDEPLDWSFSAVPAGTDEAHASMLLRLHPDKTYVDTLADLETVQGSWVPPHDYRGINVPPEVMLQLKQHAIAPEKPVETIFANQRLGRLMMARQAGTDFEINQGFSSRDAWLPTSQRGPDYVDLEQMARKRERQIKRYGHSEIPEFPQPGSLTGLRTATDAVREAVRQSQIGSAPVARQAENLAEDARVTPFADRLSEAMNRHMQIPSEPPMLPGSIPPGGAMPAAWDAARLAFQEAREQLAGTGGSHLSDEAMKALFARAEANGRTVRQQWLQERAMRQAVRGRARGG